MKPTNQRAFHQFAGQFKLYSAGKYTVEFYSPQPEYVENAENNQCAALDNVSLAYVGKIPSMVIIVR